MRTFDGRRRTGRPDPPNLPRRPPVLKGGSSLVPSIMGWDNPPVPWREFERRLSWGTRARRAEGGSTGRRSPGRAPVTRLPPGGASPAAPARAGPAWAELHCHSSYSFLDGASSPEELVAEAAELGLAALAITDHDGMYGVPQFAQAAARLREQAGTGSARSSAPSSAWTCPRERRPSGPGRSPAPAALRHAAGRDARPGRPAPAGAGPRPGGLPAAVPGDQRGAAGRRREGPPRLRRGRAGRRRTTGTGSSSPAAARAPSPPALAAGRAPAAGRARETPRAGRRVRPARTSASS